MTNPAERAIALKALHERAGTEAEALAAAKALAKHLAKHRLEMADIEDGSPVSLHEAPIFVGARIAVWRTNLLCGLGRLYGCVPWVERRWPDGRNGVRKGRKRPVVERHLRLCGLPEDVARVRELFDQLSSDVERLGREFDGHRRSFRVGFVQGLLDNAQAGAAEAEAECTAIVHVGDRYDESACVLKQAYGVDVPKVVGLKSDRDSYDKGYAEGQKRHVGERLAAD